MEIVHFCPRPSFSGLEYYALLLAAHQKNSGHNVKFVVLPNSPLEAKCREQGVSAIRLGRSVRWGKGFFTKTPEKKILHLHSTVDVGLLSPWLQSVKMFHLLNVKVILQTHIWIDHKKNDPLHWILYRAIDEFWCSSEFARQNLKNKFPVPIEKIKVIKYGRDVKSMLPQILSRKEAREKLSLNPNSTIVGSVNRIDPGKGTIEFAVGILPLLEKYPDLEMIWIGPPTGHDQQAEIYNSKLQSFLKSVPSELRSRMHFPGAIADAYKYLRAFDGYILPTYKECFSLAMLEAQLASVPVMGTNSGGTPEVVRENETGWLFKPQDTVAVTDVIERFLDNRDKWKTFANNAHERMIRDFDTENVLPEVIRMYALDRPDSVRP